MKRKKWKIVWIVLLCLLILLAVAFGVWFHHARRNRSVGKLGENVYYVLNERSGTLVVFGHGSMDDYMGCAIGSSNPDASPLLYNWDIKKAVILEGVTNVSKFAFANCGALKEVYLPASVEELGKFAFDSCRELEAVYCSGDAPRADQVYFNVLPTIYHKPGTTGWDDPIWEGYTVVEKDFKVDYSPVK